MFKKSKSLLLDKMDKLFLMLYQRYIKRRNTEIRNKVNVNVDPGMVMGDNSFFDINGQVKNLTILDKVSCRRHCNFMMYAGSELIIKSNVFFNNYCSISCLGKIEIGENTIIGEGVKIYDHNHEYHYKENDLRIERERFTIGQVTIGNNCWIGSNVTILKDVQIGDNTIIGANCLVVKSIPANSIVKHKEELIISSKATYAS